MQGVSKFANRSVNGRIPGLQMIPGISNKQMIREFWNTLYIYLVYS